MGFASTEMKITRWIKSQNKKTKQKIMRIEAMNKPIKKMTISLLLFITLPFASYIKAGLSDYETLPKVIIETELGNITVAIDQRKAPISATNFLRYVDDQRYKETSFYRVVKMNNQPQNDIKVEVIQGGIRFEESDLILDPIKHETTEETGILHKNGVISMARDQPGTASSDYFICIGDQPELDFGGKRNPDGQGFAAFGYVIDGMDVVIKIQEQTDNEQMLVKPIQIKGIKRIDIVKNN